MGAPGPVHAADSHDLIRVHRARENNLKNVSAEIPKRRLTLGPGTGHDGGRVVFECLPSDLAAARHTLTGQDLAEYVGSGASTVAKRT
jgi:excinuclease UvrABC ATPase subunit